MSCCPSFWMGDEPENTYKMCNCKNNFPSEISFGESIVHTCYKIALHLISLFSFLNGAERVSCISCFRLSYILTKPSEVNGHSTNYYSPDSVLK